MTAMAEGEDSEPRYYTWVDAQGVMHNTLITPSKNTPQNNSQVSEEKSEQTVLVNASEFNTKNFPSEEDHQKQSAESKLETKPFFTWTDAEGVIRSEVKPDVLVDFVAEEIVYDAVFAPPFRLPNYVKQGDCCEGYAEAFTAKASFNGSASYLVDDTLHPFQTQFGNVSAGYFSVPQLANKEIVSLKGYKLPKESSFEVIALDKSFQPLYLGTNLKGLFVEQTWKDLAYKKILLEISDPSVQYLIVFVRPVQTSKNQIDSMSQNLKPKEALSNYRLSVTRDQLVD